MPRPTDWLEKAQLLSDMTPILLFGILKEPQPYRKSIFIMELITFIRILWVAAVPSYHAGRNHLAALNLSRYGAA